MTRLLWVSSERALPEESFAALAGLRPAPEALTFAEATPQEIGRRLTDVILVDGRGNAGEAAAVIRKLRAETEAPLVAVLEPADLSDFDWKAGAADFVLAGAEGIELEARLSRLSRLEDRESSEVIRRGEISVDRDRFEVRVRDEVLDLTYKEFELIAYLVTRPGRVCTRGALLREVWGYDFFGGTRTVDVHIRRLRAKLGPRAHMIETVRNVGYRFSG